MAPNHGLIHPTQYNPADSNIALLSTPADHALKHASSLSEPAWTSAPIGHSPGLFIWRVVSFTLSPVPASQHGTFFSGDSYIILSSTPISGSDPVKLSHAIHFFLGAKTSQDEAGVAAYKTVELDEFLGGAAMQYREVQACLSEGFLRLFPQLVIREGGVASGFRHVEAAAPDETVTLLRVFKHPQPGGGADAVVVCEVEARWESLDAGDVFVLEKGGKIWVWQGEGSSPMEKARAALVVGEMQAAKRVEVEVVAQREARAAGVVRMLGGQGGEVLKAGRPVVAVGSRAQREGAAVGSRGKRLFKLSDESGELRFGLVKDAGEEIARADLDGDDVFVLDDAGRMVWVWEGQQASRAEKAMWLKVAQAYVQRLREEDEEAYLTPIAKVCEGFESAAFLQTIEA
ncbi:putative actin-binding protein [Staphylotrichum tortipilum]|uniref:Actin-binding protein n=1 Tax=Staphylotrichum tortipilum TaxID=2831512 RepID=A0AAN6MFR7_9PEZI|nr:putative actin-binding protein [Staphylotrichum longicolle]